MRRDGPRAPGCAAGARPAARAPGGPGGRRAARPRASVLRGVGRLRSRDRVPRPRIARHHRSPREDLGPPGVSDSPRKDLVSPARREPGAHRTVLATIGYEGATVAGFLAAL